MWLKTNAAVEMPYAVANYEDDSRVRQLSRLINEKLAERFQGGSILRAARSTSVSAEQAELARRVFITIAGRFRGKADDIGRFVATGYSFEEWCNWEALSACATVTAWVSRPKPSYCKLTHLPCTDYGDLLVTDRQSSHSVLVEIGLVHDQTGDKWIEKLDWDMDKLSMTLHRGIIPFQLIVLASLKPISGVANWERWLSRTRCWGRETDLTSSCALGPAGQLVIRGWLCGNEK